MHAQKNIWDAMQMEWNCLGCNANGMLLSWMQCKWDVIVWDAMQMGCYCLGCKANDLL